MLNGLAALGQESRLDAFRLLVRAGATGMPAGEISECLGIRQNTMSAHLSTLQQSGLIGSRREGRTIRYFADMQVMGALLAFLLEDCCGGRPEQCQSLLAELACADE